MMPQLGNLLSRDDNVSHKYPRKAALLLLGAGKLSQSKYMRYQEVICLDGVLPTVLLRQLTDNQSDVHTGFAPKYKCRPRRVNH